MPPGWVPKALWTWKKLVTSSRTSSNRRVLCPLGASNVFPCMRSQIQPTGEPRRAAPPPADEREPTGLPIGIEQFDPRDGVVGRDRRAELHGDRIADVAEEFHVTAVQVHWSA